MLLMIVNGDSIFWILSFNLLSDAAYATTSPVALISPPTCSLAATEVPAVPILTLPPGLKNKSVEPPVDIVFAPVDDENDNVAVASENTGVVLNVLVPEIVRVLALSTICFQAPQVVDEPYLNHILPLSVNPNSFAPPPDQSVDEPYFLKYITPL